MHILLLTHYFPPEVNAPANRAYDHARRWVERGHQVTIVTCTPSHPTGRPYPGYRNRPFQRATVDGIDVIRLGTWLSVNAGTVGRICNFVSFFAAVLIWQWRFPRTDVVLSTSPQFFCGIAGWLLRRRHRPWVLEIRDLWPESVVAVGAMRRGLAIRLVEAIEHFAYRKADLVVSVTNSFVRHIAPHRPGRPIIVVRNGVVAGALAAAEADVLALRRRHGLNGKWVAAYIGTHGMAHSLDTMIDAAVLLRNRTDIALVMIGDGAERQRLRERAAALSLDNLVMIDQQPRSEIPAIWGITDAALVLLRKSDTFLSVLPSKMFEAMAAACPVVLAVEGEAKALLEEAGAGVAIAPDDAAALAQAIVWLKDHEDAAAAMGTAGADYVARHLERNHLADQLLDAMLALPR